MDKPRVLALALALEEKEKVQDSLEELKGLVEAAGTQVVMEMIQQRSEPDGRTYFGKGKVEEIIAVASEMEIDFAVVDDELSGSHLHNLSELLPFPIMDRTSLILDIFAQRSRSRLSKDQVEIAQLRYNRAHLVGVGKFLSQQGGGIGTRGPGETKLEMDRRKIDDRISELSRRIKEQKAVLQTQRKRRLSSELPRVALVGYTNAGKSSLMNWFIKNYEAEGSSVKAEDMLFASLETYVRRIKLEEGMEFFLIDTVGFVRKLPHLLIDAFHSTLEEVRYADLLLHVLDGSREDAKEQEEATTKVLAEVGGGDLPRIDLLNKMDLGLGNSEMQGFPISIKTGENMEEMLSLLKRELFGHLVMKSFLFPYHAGSSLSAFLEEAHILEQKHLEEGTWVLARVNQRQLQSYGEYLDETH